ncbi:MAG: translation initiation factor IF-2 [Bacteroidales bacterium]|nr:translation initiation factor IF-2 [Bacteroidales bacterium]
MAETKNIRLNKAAKEFNVGIQNLVDFLKKKGHEVEMNPNTRITPEQYAILAKEYQSEKEVKEQADKIELATSGDVVSIDNGQAAKASTKETRDEEVIIKNVAFVETRKEQPKEKPAAKAKEEPKEEPEVTPEPEVEQAPEPEPVEQQAPVDEEVKSDKKLGGLKVVDKIDLSGLETPKPAKRSKKSKESEPQKTPKAPKAEPKLEAPAPVEEEKKEQPAPQPEKVIEFVPTEYQKLEGPKVVNKIDLSQFEKAKPVSEGERRRRKRIRKEGVKVDGTAVVSGVASVGARPEGTKPPKDKKSEKQGKKKTEKKKVEIDDNEIEKQIRDTLSRLGSKGKSATSKHNREKRQKVHQRMEEELLNEMEEQKMLQVTEFVTANELATMMQVPVTKIIATCMSVGIFVSINQRLDAETIKLIADEFGFDIKFASEDVVNTISKIEEEDRPEDLVTRNPIITVMGHVDHGKTSLLDYIRKTNVIAGEAGGITQHIGAYEVQTADGRKITFLDTPGHEAFTAMRARGAKMTDIAIIVIAADDKIMPQTVEAINHAQSAGVPIVFAINKIDKPGADPDRIKTELANMNLLIEEWGGKYQSQDISAKKGIGVEELLEKVILQADIMELKGNPSKRAKGVVIESALDKGRGYVAKLLVQDGTIRKGDPIVAGAVAGRVRAMYNERNQEVMSAGPSQPVLLLGLTGACQAGDTFNVMENEKEAKDIATKRTQLAREQGLRTQTHLTLEEIGRRRALGNFKELNIIVKGDVDGSVEALSDSLIKLGTDEVQVNVIHKAVGQISENDVMLAMSSDAIIIGFQVRPSVGARKMAETEHIDIRLYSIIYDAINELKDAIEGMLAPETQEKITCNLEVRETFKISKVGTIAGCMCLDGKIARSTSVRIIRDGIVVYTGKLASLKRFKDDVKEVVSGQDCGLSIENFNDIKVGDIVEGYEVIEIKRKL